MRNSVRGVDEKPSILGRYAVLIGKYLK